MYDKDVTAFVYDALRDCCGPRLPAELNPSLRLDVLQLDSLKMIQLVFEIETHYDIELQEHLLFQVDTLGDLLLLVQRTRNRAA